MRPTRTTFSSNARLMPTFVAPQKFGTGFSSESFCEWTHPLPSYWTLLS